VRSITGSSFAPFFVESALMYGYVRDVAAGKKLSKPDPALKGVEHYRVDEQMSVGLEYFLGWGLKLRRLLFDSPVVNKKDSDFEDNPEDTAWVRNQIRLWTCLTAGFVFLWLIAARCSWYYALLGGVLQGVAPAAVARYTGQDLLKGEFALPFIAAAFAFAQFALRKKNPWWTILTAAMVFCATSFWDASQLCFGAWGCFEILRVACGAEKSSKRRNLFIAVYAAMILSAILIPYNRAHGSILSPVTMFIWPTLLTLYFIPKLSFKKNIISVIAAAILFFVVWQTASYKSCFSDNYSHFRKLAVAKLQYLNVKPTNPEKLDFEQRFLWTPGLNSATLAETSALFPAGFWMFTALLIFAFGFRRSRAVLKKNLSRSLIPVGMCIFFFIFYIFFVRFHIFTAFFMCAALPLLFDDWHRILKSTPSRMIILLMALSVFGIEFYYSATLKRSYPPQFLKEVAETMKWIRSANVKGKVILADMSISPLLKGYCDAAIVIQPKFELAEVRRNVKQYVNLIFHGSEYDFAEYCARNKVDFLIFTENTCNGPLHIYSYRYMAAATHAKRFSTAWKMDNQPRGLLYFYELAPPPELKAIKNRFRLFKFISPAMRRQAAMTAELAVSSYREGNTVLARKLARAAYLTDPLLESAYLAYYKVFSAIPRAKLKDYSQ
jgi:hypothetical protein